MIFLVRIAILGVVVAVSRAIPIPMLNEAAAYLSQFGYLDADTPISFIEGRSSNSISTEGSITEAIKEFQEFSGLDITGELDSETLKLMNTPRCGVKDKHGNSTSSRGKRYDFMGTTWPQKTLTYMISKYTHKLSTSDVDKEVRRAFDVWSSVTPLVFIEKRSGPVDIEIKFEQGHHGDGVPFDGSGTYNGRNELAHAFSPTNGDAHFDDAEQWTINGGGIGTDLFQVALHEFGHSLGLAHSNVKAAVMAPHYKYDPNFKLHSDDIIGIQALYGKKDNSESDSGSNSGNRPGITPPIGKERLNAELCNDASIDTIFSSAGAIYFFKGLYYWKLGVVGLEAGYPRLISDKWVGLPGSIDAAFTYPDGKTYFFKGSQYWQFAGDVKESEGSISIGFPGIPDNIDAAMVGVDGRSIVFYKGLNYWLYIPSGTVTVYSMGISLDAVLHAKDYIYSFKGGNFWRVPIQAMLNGWAQTAPIQSTATDLFICRPPGETWYILG